MKMNALFRAFFWTSNPVNLDQKAEKEPEKTGDEGVADNGKIRGD